MVVVRVHASCCRRNIEVPSQQKSKAKPLVQYRYQRYYHSLQTGHYLLKQARRQDPVRVAFRQSEIDGACGLHALCSVLVIFDLAKSVALVDMAKRKYGVPAMVFEAFKHTYFTGVNPAEFVRLVHSLDLGLNLTLVDATKADCDRWLVDCLMAGELVAIVTANARNTSRDQHWTLAVGIEGLCVGREHRPDSILLLDPSASEPRYRPHNARLRVAMSGPGSGGGRTAERLYRNSKGDTRNQRIVWHYESEDFASEPTVLIAAVRLRLSEAQARGHTARKGIK